MTTVLCTLVSLCVCLVLVSGLPAAKRLPHDNDDVLAGSDFLSVFMHRRMADRPNGPFEPHHINSVTVNHGSPIVDLVKPYVLSNIYKSNKYGYAVNNEAENLHSTTPDVNPTIEPDVRATTLLTEPTTIQDIPTTIDFNTPERPSKFTSSPENHSTTTAESQTKLYPTIHQFGPEQIEEKVVVRVSSSVARHSHRTIETSTTHNSREVEPQAKLVDENLVSTLVTQEQPTITAVQRSEFAVEEAALPSSGAASGPEKVDRHEEVEGKVQEVSLYGKVQQGRPHQTLPVFEIHYANPPEALVSGYSNKEEIHRSDSGRSGLKGKEFQQLSPYSTDVPVNPTSYHSRVSSPTSASSIQFYREHNTGVQEAAQQPVARQPYPPQRQQADNQAASFTEQNKPTYNQPEQMYRQPDQVARQPKQSYGQPEQNYRQAEQNYGQPQQSYDKPEHNYGQLKQNYEQTEHNYEEPEQNYGQPEKSYGIPEQSYGQREEQYSQPGQAYSQPARSYGQPEQSYSQPEQNYEVDEAVSVMTNGRAHGVQTPTPTPGKPTLAENDSDQNKFGYVVEGRNFRKYRVEERTADGFIVGEYGVVSHDDGSLRGVRYTADSDINPRLIYDTLVKFLSLK